MAPAAIRHTLSPASSFLPRPVLWVFQDGRCLQAVGLSGRMTPTLSVSGSGKGLGDLRSTASSGGNTGSLHSFHKHSLSTIVCWPELNAKGPRVTETDAPVRRELSPWLGDSSQLAKQDFRPSSGGGARHNPRSPVKSVSINDKFFVYLK